MSDLLSFTLTNLLNHQPTENITRSPVPLPLPRMPVSAPNQPPVVAKKEELPTINSMSSASHVRSISGVTMMDHQRKKLFGKKISVVALNGKEFLIGVQIAALLKRETFNMYRSMKIKQIDLVRANPDQVEYFVRAGAVRSGTHSVTLVPFDDAVQFISEAQEKQQRTEAGTFSKLRKPALTRNVNLSTIPERKGSPPANSRVPSVASLLNSSDEANPILPAIKGSFDAPRSYNHFSSYQTESETRAAGSLLSFPNFVSNSSESYVPVESESPRSTESIRSDTARNRNFYRDDPLWTLLITAQEVLL